MKIEFWYIGKSTPSFINDGINMYEKRLKHYIPYSSHCFPNIKKGDKLSANELKIKESEMLLAKLTSKDYLVLLDEHGKEYRSLEFADQIEKWTVNIPGRIVFIIGGAFGFSQELLAKANKKISLGKGTYSHQLIRIMFLEQLYRAFTIIRGEKYHNE